MVDGGMMDDGAGALKSFCVWNRLISIRSFPPY